MKSYIIKGFFCAILIWVVFLGAISVFHIRNTNSVKKDGFQANQANSPELQKQMHLALQQIQDLKRRNAEIKRILGNANQGAANKRGVAGFVKNKTMWATGDPSYAYEKMRRQLELDMKEMWYSVRGHESNIGRKDFDQIQDIYRLLRSFLLKLRKEDGYEIYRERETKELSRIIRKRIHKLQNPADCASAKKIICVIKNAGCGFGCQIHHLVNCLVVAYATSRTLILESKGWKYNSEGWEQVFLPVSDTCTSSAGSTKAEWGSGNQDVEVLKLPNWPHIKPMPSYLPIAIPTDIAGRLEKVHGEPNVWWVGQFVTYLLRFQPQTQALLDEAKSNYKMDSSTPTVGVHIRRTDKPGSNGAVFHPLKEYMKHVEEYYSIQEKFKGPVKRRVFIASDDPNVIEEAGRTYNGTKWQIMGDKSVAESASVAQRHNGLLGIIKDIFLLSECEYLVCTFTSNICLLAYELMQTKHADASGRFVSLDATYYYHAGWGNIQTAQFVHKPRNSGELELAVGDKIAVAKNGNHWNGTSTGRNHRTHKVGLYPSYKAQNSYVKVNFPKKKWWTKSGEV